MADSMSAPKLTPKQSMFVKEYLIDLNATQAAIRAGYSEKTAKAQGCRLLTNVYICAEINKGKESRAQVVAITAQDVLESIIRIRGKAEDAEKYNDALKANELLGKHLKLFTDKTELTGAGGEELSIKVVHVQAK